MTDPEVALERNCMDGYTHPSFPNEDVVSPSLAKIPKRSVPTLASHQKNRVIFARFQKSLLQRNRCWHTTKCRSLWQIPQPIITCSYLFLLLDCLGSAFTLLGAGVEGASCSSFSISFCFFLCIALIWFMNGLGQQCQILMM